MSPSQVLSAELDGSRDTDSLGAAASRAATTMDRSQADMSSAFGQIVWLLMSSPLHRQTFLADLERTILPALMCQQYRIFKHRQVPVGFVTWAYVNDEIDARFLAGKPVLKPEEWRSGDRIWVVDLVAPFGGAESILRHMSEQALATEAFRLIRLNPENGSLQVQELHGVKHVGGRASADAGSR
jgi:cytolysin-activating lysine-acyltransferase